VGRWEIRSGLRKKVVRSALLAWKKRRVGCRRESFRRMNVRWTSPQEERGVLRGRRSVVIEAGGSKEV